MTADLELRRQLQHRFASAPPMPDLALREILERIPETSQRRSAPGSSPLRYRPMLNATSLVAAGIVIAVFGGAAIVTLQQPAAPPSGASVASTPAAATAAAQQDPSPEVTSAPSDRVVAGPGPWLAWERAPELDDATLDVGSEDLRTPSGLEFDSGRPIVWDERSGDLKVGFASGEASRSKPHGILDGYEPLELAVRRPDGSVERHAVDRAYKVGTVLVGPSSILLETRRGVAVSGIEQLAVEGRFRKGERRGPCCELQADGTVTTDGSGGLPGTIGFEEYARKLRQIGLRRDDLAQARRYWLWADAGWAEVDGPPRVRRPDAQLAATRDGFFALDDDGRLHHSPAGQDGSWSVVANVPVDEDHPLRMEAFGDDLVVSAGGRLYWAGPGGLEAMPFNDALTAEGGPWPTLASDAFGGWDGRTLQTDLGLVMVSDPRSSVLVVQRDGGWGYGPEAPRGEGSGRLDVVDGQLIGTLDGKRYRAVLTSEPPG